MMKHNPVEAARAAGWLYWFGIWICTDWGAIVAQEAPPYWHGSARDLCLAQGIEHA